MTKTKRLLSRACGVVVLIAGAVGAKGLVQAQDATHQMLDPSLRVRTVVSGLTVPVSLPFATRCSLHGFIQGDLDS